MIFKKILVLAGVVLLVSCASSPNYDAYLSSPEALTYPNSIAEYQTKAELASDLNEKNKWLLKTAGRFIHEGMLTRARQQLNKLVGLTPELMSEKNLLLAKLAVLKRAPSQALRLASNISDVNQMPHNLQKFYHQLLADAYHLQSKKVDEVNQLIELDNLQRSSLAKLDTRRLIWRALSSMPLSREKAVGLEAQGELEGWLSLNIITKELRDSGVELVDAIERWQKQHPNHPANDIVVTKHKILKRTPKKMALLLPLSGNLSGPGQAIRDGFMASYFESKSKGATVRFYDTNNKDVSEQYKVAVQEGAELVIGPLTKANVDIIANEKISVPTIALNDIERAVSDNFYRFSIDPQNEARQLAYKVHHDGFHRALVLAPRGKWGESIARAFLSRWQQQGGEVAQSLYFDGKTDVNQFVRQLLGISESHERYNNLVQTIWKRPKFYARRRQDFDVVILLSYASMARQLRPMLKYYYAGDVPVYGTSLLYSGSPKSQLDMDLNGVIFGEMPYLLSPSKRLISKSWPEQLNSYNRLYAMGRDAFLLSHQLNQLKLFPMMGVLDNTGTLFIDGDGQIIRQLEWAQFKRGLVKPLVEGA